MDWEGQVVLEEIDWIRMDKLDWKEQVGLEGIGGLERIGWIARDRLDWKDRLDQMEQV